jgi:hypothetical protein
MPINSRNITGIPQKRAVALKRCAKVLLGDRRKVIMFPSAQLYIPAALQASACKKPVNTPVVAPNVPWITAPPAPAASPEVPNVTSPPNISPVVNPKKKPFAPPVTAPNRILDNIFDDIDDLQANLEMADGCFGLNTLT